MPEILSSHCQQCCDGPEEHEEGYWELLRLDQSQFVR